MWSCHGDIYPTNREAASNIFAHIWVSKTFLQGDYRESLNQKLLRNTINREPNPWVWGKGEAFLLTIENPYEEASRESAINWIHELNRAANSLIGRTLSLNGDLTITAGNQKRAHHFQIKIRQSKVTYQELDGKSPEKHLWRGTRPGVQYFGRPPVSRWTKPDDSTGIIHLNPER